MVEKLDVVELMKVLPGVDLPYSLESNHTVCTLISVHDAIEDLEKGAVEILLQKDPEITCSFRVDYFDALCASIKLKSKNPCMNLRCKASLYFNRPHLEKNFIFLEDVHLSNFRYQSTFKFSRPIEVDFDENSHCFLFLRIAKKDNYLPPMQVKSPKSEIIEDLSFLFKNKLFTDVKIICQDQVFSAHKLLLVARSPVFQAMFEHNMKESQENKVTITDVEPEIFEHMLRFIYTETVKKLKEGQAEKLLAAANKYALEDLKLICMKEMAKSVRAVDEGFELVAIAEKYNLPGFRDIFLDFARKNPK